MKVMKKRMVTREIEEIEKEVCDKCGNEIRLESYFSIFRSNFVSEVGHGFPEGGDKKIIELDFCKECNESVIDLLRSNGINITEREVSW